MGVFHLTMHVASLNPLTFEDNLYLGHTEVCVSVGVVWAYSKGPTVWIICCLRDCKVFGYIICILSPSVSEIIKIYTPTS